MKSPSYPDPAQTANQQLGLNTKTAIAQTGLNSINQQTPFGNLTYTQVGKWPDGTPHFVATTTLSPAQQKLFDTQNALSVKLGGIGLNQADRIGKLLGAPLDLSNGALEKSIAAHYDPRLDERFGKDYQNLESELANRGIGQGSSAYDAAIKQFNEGKNDAYNQVLIGARGQALQEMLTQRNQPINEITALMGGSQVQQPQFGSTPQSGIGDVNYSGLVTDQYKAQRDNANAFNGGLFNLGSSLLGGWAMSDKRLKKEIRKVGKIDGGPNIYKFRYNDDTPGFTRLGMMAQDVEKHYPEAVAETASGYKAVNYDRVAERV